MTTETSLRQEIATEQRHLDRVYARLAQLRLDAHRAERDGYRLAWVGNLGALVERDAMVLHAARRRHTLDAEHEGLVFGRLDRVDGRVEYVGRLGIRDSDTTPLVIDWRAPAAADFYQATATDPRGVVRRRMIRSTGERVTGLDDDLLDPAAAPPELPVIGDGALLASLTRTTGRGMRDIVATIQREQDEAIRSPASGVTVVEGGPGTGKTAVALHRAAYLLYRDRSRFAGGGILVVGPSPVFVNYIAAVLPSLGEQSATLRALGDLVDGVRATRADPGELAAVKGSLRMLTVLRRAVSEQVPGAPTQFRVAWRGALLRLDAGTLEAIRRRALSRHRGRNEVRRAAFDGIFDALWEEVRSQLPGFTLPRLEFEEEISDRREFRDFLRAWWPLLRPVQVLSWLADPDRLARWGDGVLSAEEVAALAESFAAALPGGTAGRRDGGRFSVPDVAVLDELAALLGRPPGRRAPAGWPGRGGSGGPAAGRDPYLVAAGVRELATTAERHAPAVVRDRSGDEFAHVVIDEAQDVSPLQWRMLGRRGRHASWTVVGDPAQTAWAGDPDELTRARDAALRGSRHRHVLTTNYRNSVEIFDLAASVIRRVAPEAHLPTAVRVTGVPPVTRTVPPGTLPESVRTAVAELLEQVEGTVGVITPEGRRDRVAGWLGGPDPARLQVVTALEAKGMEYDGVVLVEPDQVEQGAGARTLYVALSRATRRLTTVATTPWRH